MTNFLLGLSVGLLLWLVELIRHELHRRRSDKRESSLLNRVQARDLQEYVAVERRPEPTRTEPEDSNPVIPEGFVEIVRPEIDLVSVNTAERGLGIS
jgi:hypothetical protein